MTVRMVEGSGTQVCPKGWYALYEHEEFNSKENGRVLIADQSLGDVEAFGFDGRIRSAVNHTEQSIALHVEADFKGFAAQVGPRNELKSLADRDTRDIDGVGQILGESRTKLGPELGDRAASVRVFAHGSDAAQVIKLPFAEGTYVLTNVGSGMALDVLGTESENGANVGQWDRHGGTNQQWTVTAVRRDYSKNPIWNLTGEYEIVSKASGKALEVAGASLDDTANVQQWDRTDSINQRWWITPLGNDVYALGCVRSGKMLDVEGGSKERRANVRQYTWNDTDAQKWRLQRI